LGNQKGEQTVVRTGKVKMGEHKPNISILSSLTSLMDIPEEDTQRKSQVNSTNVSKRHIDIKQHSYFNPNHPKTMANKSLMSPPFQMNSKMSDLVLPNLDSRLDQIDSGHKINSFRNSPGICMTNEGRHNR
jgi:hypothetical protein